MSSPYKVDCIRRHISIVQLELILIELRVSNRARIPPNNFLGSVYLDFRCQVYFDLGYAYCKFTNDDRRTFIKLATRIPRNGPAIMYQIGYRTSLVHGDLLEDDLVEV
jgi:hypothetical protein